MPFNFCNFYRFEKRIYIALPEAQERADMFRENISNVRCDLSERDILELGTMTEGYSLNLLHAPPLYVL